MWVLGGVFIVLVELFVGVVEVGFEGDNVDVGGVGYFLLVVVFLGKGDEGVIGGFEFGEGVVEGVEFFVIYGCRGFGDFEVFFLFEWGKKVLLVLVVDVIDVGVVCYMEELGFELGGLIEMWECVDYFDENNLGEIFDGIIVVGD